MTLLRLGVPVLLIAWLSLAPDLRPALGNTPRGGAASVPQPDVGGPVALVPVVSADEVLAAIRQGRTIVFVDAREVPEYEEEHIPGALNLPLRAVPGAELAAYAGADLVIPYCLKDFRGFEVARALRSQGVANVRLLSRPGINGWKADGLPTAGAVPGRTDQQARALLSDCAQTRHCLKGR